jgi:hypothetical protein
MSFLELAALQVTVHARPAYARWERAMDRGMARERARTWPQGRARALVGGIRWPALDVLAQRFVEAFRVAAIAEAGPGRLVPWVPVSFGIGIAT